MSCANAPPAVNGDRGGPAPAGGDAQTSELVANLEQVAPSTLPPDCRAVLFCRGICFHSGQRIVELRIDVGGVRHRLAAFGMSRPDASPGSAGRRGGFWGAIPIWTPADPGEVELRACVRLEGGDDLTAHLGSIQVATPETATERPGVTERLDAERPSHERPALIAVCMATFEPDLELFRVQIESLRAQTDRNWICVISDDCSTPDQFERIAQVVGPDERFVLSRAPARGGFYANFERVLRLVPEEAQLVALCDQDDRWYLEKLEVLRGSLGDAQLVYCDQRLVDREGGVLRETLWKGRRNNYDNLASQLIANSITGAATLFRRELLDALLPFPQGPGYLFHDHWLGTAAMATGQVAYVNRPLYDYVQHRGAILGHVADVDTEAAAGRKRALHAGRARGLLERWRAAYFYGYVARELQARTLLVRCPETISPQKRRVLERFLASARAPLPFAWLAIRPLRAVLGANETLGSETDLVRGIMWRWLAGIGSIRGSVLNRMVNDATLPDPASFDQRRLRRWRANI